ncbi:hypothetical protein K1X13_05320 [Nocardioides sp. WL0053]|uniref:Uncharacterized protein n=1 Tax=Nocardioides jiangsuensis TaxID=2866161 RepID=A0ABS7RGR9_9ACTN|nr:hypothetical protein [Nocardioides jiangsuensis]MBY9074238.1 hypothetical protein [Nocardioides jiangsuensis]
MSDISIYVDSNYQWSVNSGPEFVMVQVPPLAVMSNDPKVASFDGWQSLLAEIGFARARSLHSDQLPTTSNAELRTIDARRAELNLTLPDGGTGSFAIPHGESNWDTAVRQVPTILVLFTQTAIGANGQADNTRLQNDLASGGLFGAHVAVSQ